MHQLRREEKAALLLAVSGDDDDDDANHDNHEMTNTSTRVENDNFPTIAKRPKSSRNRRGKSTHPVLCFTLILGTFAFGCLSGVIIMLYRMSQDAERQSSASASNSYQMITNVDLSIQKRLLQSITKDNFINFNRSVEIESDIANKLYEEWKSLSPSLTNVNKFSYDINLSNYVSSNQWNGIQLIDGKTEKQLLKVDRLSTENLISYSSLVKSATINANSIYYVNYGRQEDFAYLFNKGIRFEEQDKSILFLRRKSTLLSQTEQIHQAIYYGFNALVLFDDNENDQITTTNDRQTFLKEWARHSPGQDRENFANGLMNTKDHSISVLILSFDDVQKLFGSIQSDSKDWFSCPSQWHNKATTLKIGGKLSNFKLQFVVNTVNMNIQLPVVISSIRGNMDAERFIMIGYQLSSTQQNQIIKQIIQAYTNQIKNGWKPRRSILFCAWSGLDYDQYTIRRWISDNSRLINRNLLTYIDLGYGVIANSTLNLHGSSLLEQVAHHAADLVPSPLKHNHTCHHRQMATMPQTMEEHHHDHGRKRRDEEHQHEHGQTMETNQPSEQVECEPHKLLDEWMRATKNRFGPNITLSIVQSIDSQSSAALFQLQYGIPSIVIEMTQEQVLINNTFNVVRSPPVYEDNIEGEVYVAYAQFVSEIIRKLIDEPLIPFNLTNYADQIDKQVKQYVDYYNNAYNSLGYHLGSREQFIKTLNDLTKSIRQIQSRIDQLSSNDFVLIQSLNRQLIDFERLFITNDQLRGVNSPDKVYKHMLIGPAFGLTNTVVPFPSLSNILNDIPGDPPGEICDIVKLLWSKFEEQIHLINRTLNGFDGLLTKDK